MAKLTKTALKSIVKECLVEILAEGIGSSSAINESKKVRKTKAVKKSEPEPVNKNFDRVIDQTVGSITDDDIMREILADTAKGTLQEQLSHERSRPGAVVSSDLSQDTSSAGINLDGIFSSASENWTSLAFAEKKNQ